MLYVRGRVLGDYTTLGYMNNRPYTAEINRNAKARLPVLQFKFNSHFNVSEDLPVIVSG